MTSIPVHMKLVSQHIQQVTKANDAAIEARQNSRREQDKAEAKSQEADKARKEDEAEASNETKTDESQKADASESSQNQTDQSNDKSDFDEMLANLTGELESVLVSGDDLPELDAPPIQTQLPSDFLAKLNAIAGADSAELDAESALSLLNQQLAQNEENEALLADMLAQDAQALANDANLQSMNAQLATLAQEQALKAAANNNSFDMSQKSDGGELQFTQRAGLNLKLDGNVLSSAEQATGQLNSVVGQPNSQQAQSSNFEMALNAARTDAAKEAGSQPTTSSNSTSATSAMDAANSASKAAQIARDPVMAHRAVNNAGLEIARAAINGRTRFEIKLDPPELGRIEVRMQMDKEKAAARIIIEKPETLDLMMRDKSQLERVMAAAGLELEGGIDMQLKDQGGTSDFGNLLGDDRDSFQQANTSDASGPDAGLVSNEEDQLMSDANLQAIRAAKLAELNPYMLNRIA